jgi:ABC-2 type transport system permease protein
MKSINLKGWLALVVFLSRRTLVNRRMIIVAVSALLPISLVAYTVAEDLPTGIEDLANFLDTIVLSFFLLFIPIIYGSSILRRDLENNSITMILTSPLNRPFVYLGYFASLFISVIVAMLIITSVGPLTLFALVGIETGALELYINVCALTIIGSIVYSSLYLTVSLITKRVIYFGLFYAFFWEGFVGFLPGGIGDFTIRHYIRSIGSSWFEYSELGVYQGSGVLYSFLVLTVVTVTLVALGAYLLYVKEME